MVRNNPKKQFALFVIGCLVNLILFILAKYTPMPLWLDYTGSIYITVMCGPVYAFASLLIHTLLVALFIDGATAFLVVLPIVAVCVIFYLADKRGFEPSTQGISAVFTAFVSAFIIFSIILLLCKQLPVRYSNLQYLFDTVLSNSGKLSASVTVASVTAFTEVLVSIVLFHVLWVITPKTKDNMIFKK